MRLKILNLELNKSDVNSSVSSFQASSDNQSACSMHSEPQPRTTQPEKVVLNDAQSQDLKVRNMSDDKNSDLNIQGDITDLFKKFPTKNMNNTQIKDQLVAPPKLSFAAFLSPMKSDSTLNRQQTMPVCEAKVPAKLDLPSLSLTFPLLSHEETALVQPLSPLSGSSISTTPY